MGVAARRVSIRQFSSSSWRILIQTENSWKYVIYGWTFATFWVTI